MNPEHPARIEDAVAPGVKRPKVIANYYGYEPPFDVVPLIERMLDSAPPKYLLGLKEIVLTNKTGLSRGRRRSVTKARGRKVRIIGVGGLYHPAWKADQAWIELFVDNILRGWDKGKWPKIQFLRERPVGNILFHEIGHHLHATSHPEFREREDMADVWKVRLGRFYARSGHPWMRKFLYPLRPLIRVLARYANERPLKMRYISRAEFEEETCRK